ncbi:MAG TPA: SpoIIE family protein phosphatase [Terriglobales bacterium]|nr:SpoIIE family protein phosphatase [Terriglobales bacterium]
MTNVPEKRTVLVVDDAPANIQVVHAILKDDYKIRVATSGAKALDLMKVKPFPDLVLLDVMMPDMDGYEVCGIMKATPEAKDIPVIFLTGKTEADDETKGFEMGAVDYIHKPFLAAVVKARVHTHLMLREAREQLSRQLVSINSELEMARKIQLAILPHETPKITGLEIAARFVPMGSVAGDFYDFIVVDEKHVGILIADATGHGLPAALIASMLQMALAAQFAHASSPSAVLAGLNHALCGKFTTHFVTAAYIFLDMERRIMKYGGAGHPPLLLWRASTRVAEELEKNGLVLGLFADASYDEIEATMQFGDRVVPYTDGILEASNPSGEMYGAERFKRFLESNCSTGTNEFSEALLDELSLWSGQPRGQGQQDDITFLTIDFKDH